MTKFLSVAVLGVGAGASIFAAPPSPREGAARDSSIVADDGRAAPAFATVSGRVTILASDARVSRDVAAAVVYLEPIAPLRPPPAPAPADAAPRPMPALATPAPRDTVRLLWAAVQELRETVTELREALRMLRAQLAGGPRPADAAVPPVAAAGEPPAAPVTAASGPPRGDAERGVAVPAVPGARVASVAPARVIPTAVIAMRQKEFVPHVRVVEIGGSVEYPNRDPFSHNVFSSTPGGAFDLGLYPKGESRAAVFRRPGAYSIFCNIHAKMSAFVIAVPSPHHTQPSADGRFSIAGVPPGRYRVHVWHERAPQLATLVTVGDRGLNDVALTLDARTYRQAAHLNKFGQPYPAAGRDDY